MDVRRSSMTVAGPDDPLAVPPDQCESSLSATPTGDGVIVHVSEPQPRGP
jgi:hypothetical protein